jgi:hypothetical protein
VRAYAEDVRSGEFPTYAHSFRGLETVAPGSAPADEPRAAAVAEG